MCPRKLVTDLAFQEQILHHEGAHGQRFLHHPEYLLFAKGLDEVVERPLLHGRHGGGDITMARHHHHGKAHVLSFHLAQHRQAIHLGHFHVTQQEIHLVLLDVGKRLFSRGSGERRIPLALENHFEGA